MGTGAAKRPLNCGYENAYIVSHCVIGIEWCTMVYQVTQYKHNNITHCDSIVT